jgi:tRNA(Ile)-lysidine synthase
MSSPIQPPSLRTNFFKPGLRVAVACSGGADSVALLRTLLEHRDRFGVVLSVAHMNHGLRDAESDADEAFVRGLASEFDLPFHSRRVDTAADAQTRREGIEEAARRLRYGWFWELLAAGEADAVATAHTLDDQAETVLHRILRGAWTEGLSGIQPVLKPAGRQPGQIARPFLATTRREIEPWLRQIGQPWREDASNRDVAFTRNRIRHDLLPILAEYNPAVARQLAQMAALALDEESYWQGELARLLPSLLLPGKAARGGGRATDTLPGKHSLSIEIERLRSLHPALRRRVLRAAAAELGGALDFDHTERLLALAGLCESKPEGASDNPSGNNPSRLQLQNGLRAERTPRELRLLFEEADQPSTTRKNAAPTEYSLAIPGSVEAPEFGLRIEAVLGKPAQTALPPAILRANRPGDRVTLQHSRSPLKIREAFRRARLPAPDLCPLLEWQGEIVWMRGLAVQSSAASGAGLSVTETQLLGTP